jgi:hypothetical protein
MDKRRLLDELAGLMRTGVSVIVGSADAGGRPSVMRAVGARIDPVAPKVTVYLPAGPSAQLLDDIAATGRIAVVFSQPSTHRSVQLKSSRCEQRPAVQDEAPLLERFRTAFGHELASIGYPVDFAHAMLLHPLADVVAVTFEPEQAFDQTPGPRAGTPVGAAS